MTQPSATNTNGAMPPVIDPTLEHVAGGGYSWATKSKRSLPHAFDDLTRQLGDKIYDQMLLDPQLIACLNTLKTSVLEGMVQITPPDLDDQPENIALAEQIADACRRMLEHIPMHDVLWDMLYCLSHGNKVAELVWTLKDVKLKGLPNEETPEAATENTGTGQTSIEGGEKEQEIQDPAITEEGTTSKPIDDNGSGSANTVADSGLQLQPIQPARITKLMLVLDRINVKPSDHLVFVVDEFMNVLGFLARIPGVSSFPASGILIAENGVYPPNFIEREKFAVLTFRPKDNDPRGTSIFRAAYEPWWIKLQIMPEWLKYLARFASGTIIGKTPPGVGLAPKLDASGNPVLNAETGRPELMSPQLALLNTLMEVKNGSVGVVPAETEVDTLEMLAEGGEAFIRAFSLCDQWITMAILHQTLATNEGEHQARAAATVHKQVMDLVVQLIKNNVSRMLKRDVLERFVEYNWGIEYIDLTPSISLGDTEQQDFSALAQAIATLYSAKYLSPVHLQYFDTMLGVPPRPAEEIARLVKQQETGGLLADAAAQSLNDPKAKKDNPFAKKGDEEEEDDPKFASDMDSELRKHEDFFEELLASFLIRQAKRAA